MCRLRRCARNASARVLLAVLVAGLGSGTVLGRGSALAAQAVRSSELNGGPPAQVIALGANSAFGASVWNEFPGVTRLVPLVKTQSTYNEALERVGIEPHSSRPSGTRPYAVCPAPSEERFSCLSVAVPKSLASHGRLARAGPRLEGTGELGGYSPADLRSAYNVHGAGGKGVIIAITIAYDYPNAESDLAVYRETYGLSPCTSGSGCFEKVNQEGKAENYPEPRSSWAAEAALDLDMASAMCPECKLRLVEANDNTLANLPVAVGTAAALGAKVISDSWGGEEFSEETSLDAYLNHPGIPVLFASGDSSYGAQYPASSPDVVAVGGTSLRKDQSARGWQETAWDGAGSGCSEYEEKPVWQTDSGCAKRTVADVSAVADPETPVSLYDTYPPYEGWELFGGTSVATPLLAGIEGHASSAERSKAAKLFWEKGPEGKLYDITEGRDGACRPEPEYLCLAGFGYDGPTGWGSPGATGRPAPPVVGAYAASGVSESQATLNGAVNANGQATTYRFEYGPTSAYGTRVPVPNASAGSGTNPVEVAAQLTRLERDTTYHYRLLASNSMGATYGGDHTFVTSPWAVQYVPREQPQREEMLGVSCVSTSFCVSVGEQGVYYEPPAPYFNNAPLVEHWDGKEWSRESVPLYHPPGEGFASGLEGVSCATSSSCMAVGENYEIHVGYGTLVERWDGKGWSLVPAPLPGGATKNENGTYEVRLHGVWCVSATSCVLVGQFTRSWNSASPNEIGTLVERWDGTRWTVQPSPDPSGAIQSLLWGVSCVSAAACVAVGEARDSGGAQSALIEQWAGGKWSIDPSPSLSGGLQGVSCSSTSACVAVGGSEGRLGGGGVAEVWNGNNWSASALEQPMRSVSCLAPGSCIAVGGDLHTHKAYADTWNGAKWSADRLSPPNDASDEPIEMFGVSCVPSDCAGVGWYYSWGYAPLAETRSPPPAAPLDPPEYGRCLKVSKNTGKYANAGCTSAGGKDDYEWLQGVPRAGFRTKLTSGSVTLETITGSKVTCKGATSAGEYTGDKMVGALVLTLTGCIRASEKCSTGSVAGEVVSEPLGGALGVIELGASANKDNIGLDLSPVGKTGPLMEFSCGAITVSVRGSVIVPVNANRMALTQGLKFRASSGKQTPEGFVGAPKDILEASFAGKPFEQAGLTLTTTQTNEEKIEVNSVY